MWTKVNKKEIEQFPDYDGNPKNFVGSKKYWKGVFSMEKNRDPKLHEAFSELHHNIVDMVIAFCKEHNLTNIDECHIGIDGISGSIEAGKWLGYTDSSMSLYDTYYDEKLKWECVDKENPFLYEI